MDAQVGRNDRGWEVAVVPVQLNEKGKQIFGLEDLVRSNPLSICLDYIRLIISAAYPPNAPRHHIHLPA